MIDELKELKALGEKYHLSPIALAKYVGCTVKTAYNWIVYENHDPAPIWRPQIRRAVRKIKQEFGETARSKEVTKLAIKLFPVLTRQEKARISELAFSKARDKNKLLEFLREMAKIHEGGEK